MPRHPPEEARFAREVGGRGPHGERIADAIVTSHPGRSGGRMNEAEQEAEKGRLPSAVGAEEPEHLPRTDGERTPVERRERAVSLRELIRFDEHRPPVST
jgi:hypothetical protein